FCYFFFQAEDGIRDDLVTGVQTCALPILMNYLSYVMLALPRALFLNCDVVLAMTDPPFQGIVGAFLAMLKRKPYVYNIRDLYPDMAVGGNIVAPGALTRIWERLNRWALG